MKIDYTRCAALRLFNGNISACNKIVQNTVPLWCYSSSRYWTGPLRGVKSPTKLMYCTVHRGRGFALLK